MSLGEYISQMRTTPARKNSFTGLKNGRWALSVRHSVSTEDDNASKSQIVAGALLSDASDGEHSKTELESWSGNNDSAQGTLLHTHSPSTISSPSPPPDPNGEIQGAKFRHAMCNGLDLRPATALHPTHPTYATSAVGDLGQSYGVGATKEVDLGSLSAQLFFPFPRASGHKPAAGHEWDKRQANVWARPSTARPASRKSRSSCQLEVPDGGLEGHRSDEGAALAAQSVNGAEMSSQGGCLMGESRQERAWGKKGSILAGRNIHSAKPSLRADADMDPSVWDGQACTQRPPSRQKPPPEALHLFSPQAFVNADAKGISGRPQTTMSIVRGHSRPFSGPNSCKTLAVDLHHSEEGNAARPPSRQRPPPESLGLGHCKDGAPVSKRVPRSFRQIFASDDSEEDQGTEKGDASPELSRTNDAWS
eukprot:evm.model.scf_881EXC.7 EVM.evm.TU.scf_881EXC.7   scf_881EXC:48091-53281(-)